MDKNFFSSYHRSNNTAFWQRKFRDWFVKKLLSKFIFMKCEKNTAIAMERLEDLKVNVSDRLEKAIEELQVQVAHLEAP